MDNKLGKKWIIIGIVACICLMFLSATASGIIVKNVDKKTMRNGSVTLAKLEKNLSSTRDKISEEKSKLKKSQTELKRVNEQIKCQKKKVKPPKEIYDKSLATGTYVVGEDMEAGIYHFTYKLKSKDDGGWGDYIYVLHKGSSGENETIGGTKFDFRVEAENDNEAVMLKVDYGDKVFLESDHGNFVPGKK